MIARVIRALQRISFRGRCDRGEEIPILATPTLWASLFEAREVDDEAITHVVLEHALVGLVDVIDRDHLDIGGDPFSPQKSSICCVSRMPPIREPASVLRFKMRDGAESGAGSSGTPTSTMTPS